MRQLASMDAQFLAAADGRTHGHVSALDSPDVTLLAAGPTRNTRTRTATTQPKEAEK